MAMDYKELQISYILASLLLLNYLYATKRTTTANKKREKDYSRWFEVSNNLEVDMNTKDIRLFR